VTTSPAPDDDAEQSPQTPPIGGSEGTPARTGFTYGEASDVPGAVLSPERADEVREKLRAIDEAQRRARLGAGHYYVS